MPTLQARPMKEAAADFLAQKRIAVTGVSRKDDGGHGSNTVYKRLRERGYEVSAVNPNAQEVEGDPCYSDLRSIPEGVDAVVIATAPGRAMKTMRECVSLGIDRVWMHRAFGQGSVSDEATTFGREHGVHVIDGGCPCMYEPTADGAHKVLKVICKMTGKVPSSVN